MPRIVRLLVNSKIGKSVQSFLIINQKCRSLIFNVDVRKKKNRWRNTFYTFALSIGIAGRVVV